MVNLCIMYQENIENRPSVSVAMAVYNGERFIRQQIDSILCQLKNNDELVISYDNSKDATWDIIKDYSEKDKRVKCYKNPYSPGVVHNFQNALEHTTKEIIFYSDQDDYWLDMKIEKVLDRFYDDKVTVVVHDASLVDENLRITSPSTFKLRGGIKTSLWGNLVRLRYIGCCMAFRAKYKEVIIPIPMKYSSHDWWTGSVCTIGGGKMVAIQEPLIYHRIHGANVSPTKRPPMKEQLEWRWIIISNLIKRYRKRISLNGNNC